MHKQLRIALVCLSVLGCGTAFAEATTSAEKDPKQWSTPDATPQDRYETAKKEAAAAYQEALADCRSLRGAEKASCTKEAQAAYNKDLAAAKLELKQ